MEGHKVVSKDQWVSARKQLLAKEKEFTRLRDQLSQQRRELPWERVDKQYIFEGPNGKETLADLFAGRSQLERSNHPPEPSRCDLRSYLACPHR